MLNWQIGKKYRRRDGSITECTKLFITSCIHGAVVHFKEGNNVWKKNGRMIINKDGPHDIIEEVNEMKIEVGKYYKSKCVNDKIHIVHYNDRGNTAESFYLDAWGNKYYEYEIDKFIGEEWKAPKSGVAYINVLEYPGDKYPIGMLWYNNKEDATNNDNGITTTGRKIACIRVEWKEGQFDD